MAAIKIVPQNKDLNFIFPTSHMEKIGKLGQDKQYTNHLNH